MDTITMAILFVGILFFVILAFLVGKYQDIVWRCKTFRKYLKKNFIILERVSKDGKTRTARMINLDGDIFNVGNYTWVSKGGRIYRKDKESEGFKAGRHNVAWEEGVPILTVDEDSIKPLDFYKEDSTIKPEELGSTVSAWVMNQLAKGFATMKNQDLWIKLIMVLCVINLLISYTVMDGVGKLQKQGIQAPAASGTVTPQGGATSATANGSIVIKQGGT